VQGSDIRDALGLTQMPSVRSREAIVGDSGSARHHENGQPR
jgi:hypothetical protein